MDSWLFLRSATVATALAVGTAFFAPAIQAAPISDTSSLGLDGNLTVLPGGTADQATGLDFANPADATGLGDLVGFTGTDNATLQDIAAGSLVGTGAVSIDLNIANFVVVGGLAFDLGTITVIERSAITNTFTIQGNGVFRVAGFDNTNAIFTLTTQGSGFTTFSASTVSTGEVTDVPEPVSLALFGMGLLGLGAVARARRH